MRKPVVSRTLNTTVVDVLCINKETNETYEDTVTLSRTYRNEGQMLKAVKSTYDTDTVCALHILAYHEETAKYFMDENDFVALAKKVIVEE